MPPKIPPAPLGFSAEFAAGRYPKLKIELFQDLCCPFSAMMMKTLREQVMPTLREKAKTNPARYENTVEFLFQPVSQAWHMQSSVMHETAFAVTFELGKAKYWDFASAVLEKRYELFCDHQTCHMTRRELHKLILSLGVGKQVLTEEEAERVDKNWLKKFEEEQGPGLVYDAMMAMCKMHRKRGVHVTPTVFMNDVEAADVSSGWTAEQWLEKIEACLAQEAHNFDDNDFFFDDDREIEADIDMKNEEQATEELKALHAEEVEEAQAKACETSSRGGGAGAGAAVVTNTAPIYRPGSTGDMFASMYLVSGPTTSFVNYAGRANKRLALEEKVKCGEWAQNSFMENRGAGNAFLPGKSTAESGAGPPTKKRRVVSAKKKSAPAGAGAGAAVSSTTAKMRKRAAPKAKAAVSVMLPPGGGPKAKPPSSGSGGGTTSSEIRKGDMGMVGRRPTGDTATGRLQLHENIDMQIECSLDPSVLVDDPEMGEEREPPKPLPKNTVNRNVIHELNQKVLRAKRLAARVQENRKMAKDGLDFSLQTGFAVVGGAALDGRVVADGGRSGAPVAGTVGAPGAKNFTNTRVRDGRRASPASPAPRDRDASTSAAKKSKAVRTPGSARRRKKRGTPLRRKIEQDDDEPALDEVAEGENSSDHYTSDSAVEAVAGAAVGDNVLGGPESSSGNDTSSSSEEAIPTDVDERSSKSRPSSKKRRSSKKKASDRTSKRRPAPAAAVEQGAAGRAAGGKKLSPIAEESRSPRAALAPPRPKATQAPAVSTAKPAAKPKAKPKETLLPPDDDAETAREGCGLLGSGAISSSAPSLFKNAVENENQQNSSSATSSQSRAQAKKTTIPVMSAALNAHLDRVGKQAASKKGHVAKKGSKADQNGYGNFIPQSKGYMQRMRANPNRHVASTKRLMSLKKRRPGRMNFSADNGIAGQGGQGQGRALQNHYLSKREKLAKETFAQHYFVDNPGWDVPLWSRGFGAERTVVRTAAEALEKLHFNSFRRGQKEAIESVVVENLRTLLLLPTGMGKSLVYQICALLLRDEGLTLVVTPLVALMTDQLRNLPKCIRGAAINSHQTPEQSRRIMGAVRNNEVDLLFVTPERLAMWALSSRDFPVALVCVDEAHCVSVWSHNFRPTYMRLNYFFKQLNVPRVLALTATATTRAICGIQELLHIDVVLRQNVQCDIVRERVSGSGSGGGGGGRGKSGSGEDDVDVGSAGGSSSASGVGGWSRGGKHVESILRRNLTCTVSRCNEKEKAPDLARLLLQDERFCKGAVLVYVWRRKTVTAVARVLAGRGIHAVGYHSALSAEDRDRFQKEFTTNRLRVMVTTIAFGMGIDKQDIQGVIHYDMPKSLENFVQESGRCARDLTRKGHCHLYVNEEDFAAQRKYVFGSIGAHGSAVDKLLDLIFNKKRRHALLKSDEAADDDAAAQGSAGGGANASSVVLNEKETARILGCEPDEVHSLLANLERLSGDAFRLYSSFPAKVKLKFFGKDAGPDALLQKDIFLSQLLPLCRVNQGVHSVDTLQAIKKLQPPQQTTNNSKNVAFSVAATPAEFLTNLNVCAGIHKIAVERENYGYLIEVLKEPETSELQRWGCTLKAHVRQVEQVAAEQIDACYCAFVRVAEMDAERRKETELKKSDEARAFEKAVQGSTSLLAQDLAQLPPPPGDPRANKADEVQLADPGPGELSPKSAALLGQVPAARIRQSTHYLSHLIDLYFYTSEGEDVVAKIAGAPAKKYRILSLALGMTPSLLEKLHSVGSEQEESLWRTHPEYASLKKDVELHCRGNSIRDAMKKAKEPELLITNVLLGRFCTMLGPDLDARWRWMQNPLWNTQAENPFGLVHLCVKEAWEKLCSEHLSRVFL
eukprot:g1530.t1